MKYTWVQTQTKKWHAWATGGERTLCGKLSRIDLQMKAARAIAALLPEGAVVCHLCRRAVPEVALVVDPKTKHLEDPVAAAWLPILNAHFARYGLRVALPTKHTLATRLATLGSPGDPQADALYNHLRALLLTPRPRRGGRLSLGRLKEALDALPPDPQALNHIAAAVKAWCRITGREMERGGERFKTDTVITTMLAVPDPEAYIRHLHSQGLTALAQMFHPSTLDNHRTDAALRGVFGGSNEYWNRTANQLAAQVVTDEEEEEE
jgi:hypothetical protein